MSPAMYALFVLVLGIATVLVLIIKLRQNAFIALITAALLVSLLAPGPVATKVQRVADALGTTAGQIGIVVALASIIGEAMMLSGAADRVVRAFMHLLGEKRAPLALMGSGYVLSIPVFFDTVFYLLVPLARSLYKRTQRNYLLYILAICAGGAVTHTLVPPTPGPLTMAAILNIDVGTMILVGGLVGLPAALAGLLFASVLDRKMNLPMRALSDAPEPAPLEDHQLPGLWVSLAPVILPVILISSNTVLDTLADGEHAARFEQSEKVDWPALRSVLADAKTPSPGARVRELLGPTVPADDAELLTAMNRVLDKRDLYQDAAFGETPLNATAKDLLPSRKRLSNARVERLNRALLESAFPKIVPEHQWFTPLRQAADVGALLGNANLALLLSTVIAMLVYMKQRQPTTSEMSKLVETSLMSAGVIILITAAGGAFGKMLDAAQVGDIFKDTAASGVWMLLLGFGVAAVIKVAQGSSTVAMITAAGILAPLVATPELVAELGFNPVYLATAIGGGSLVGSWMNDSGFWIVVKLSGMTEEEGLKTWTPLLLVLGVTSLIVTIILVQVMPLT